MTTEFPPRAVLKSLTKFRVGLKIHAPYDEKELTEALDQEDLSEKLVRMVTNSGYTVDKTSTNVLSVFVSVLSVTSDQLDRPVDVSYFLQGTISTELYFDGEAVFGIVVNSSNHGCCDSILLSKDINHAVDVLLADTLAMLK